jgi:hypothetical protein
VVLVLRDFQQYLLYLVVLVLRDFLRFLLLLVDQALRDFLRFLLYLELLVLLLDLLDLQQCYILVS